MYFSSVIWIICFQGIVLGISVTFHPDTPTVGQSVTISCERTSSSSAAIIWEVDEATLATCIGTFCFPSNGRHTFSTDSSANVFNLSIASVSLTDCKTYTCYDVDNTADTDSSDLHIDNYFANDIVLQNLVAFTSGTISVTTGCVLSQSVYISWRIVDQNGGSHYVNGTHTTNATGCSDTCHSLSSKRTTSSVTYTECTESDCEEVHYIADIHMSYHERITFFTENFRINRSRLFTIMTTQKHALSAGSESDSIPLPLLSAIVVPTLFVFGLSVGCSMFFLQKKPWNKIHVADKLSIFQKISVGLLCLIIVGFGIFTMYLIRYMTKKTKGKSETPDGSQENQQSGKGSTHGSLCCFRKELDIAVSRTEVELQESSNNITRREESGSAVWTTDVNLQEYSNNSRRGPMPGIPQERDRNQRGLSAHFDDTVSVDVHVPPTTAGALESEESVHEGTYDQETKNSKKKKTPHDERGIEINR